VLAALQPPVTRTDEYAVTSQEKLAEIQKLALERDAVVRPLLGNDYRGGCVLLGGHYAESSNIFLGLNPGLWPGQAEYSFSEGPCSVAPFNSPFVNEPEMLSLRYPRNCERFLDAHPSLRQWFQNRVTSTFVSPWRTRGLGGLYKLNKINPRGDLFCHSGTILARMIDHHDAKMLIIASNSGPALLEDVLTAPGRECSLSQIEEGDGTPEYRGTGSYQFSEWSLTVDGRQMRVFQIPHFSRANSLPLLEPCAMWLKNKLGLM